MSEPDDLYTLRNHYWLGSYQLAIAEGSGLGRLPEALRVERDEFIYRSYLALGQYSIVLGEVYLCDRKKTRSLLGDVCRGCRCHCWCVFSLNCYRTSLGAERRRVVPFAFVLARSPLLSSLLEGVRLSQPPSPHEDCRAIPNSDRVETSRYSSRRLLKLAFDARK